MAGDAKRMTRSQRGASMPLALLLFLVCAALAAVVLAAGTAAGGRYAGLAQSDQRYYAVTSAAGLVRDQLDQANEGGGISVSCDKTFKQTTRISVDSEGRTTSGSPVESAASYGLTIDGQAPGATSSVLGLAAKALLVDEGGAPGAYAWSWSNGDGAASPSDKVASFTLEFSAPDVAAADARKCTASVTEAVEPDGTLVFTVSSGGDDAYGLELSCTPRVEVRQTPREVVSSDVKRAAAGETRTEEMEYRETRTLRVTWTDFRIRKAGSR